MARSGIDVSVIVPVRNAEGSIGNTLDAISQRLTALGGRHELVVVDDASEDASAQEAAQLALAHPEVKVIPLARRSGPGYASRVGLMAADGVHRVLLPLLEGTASPPGTWEEALARLRQGAAFVVGQRARVLAFDSRVALDTVEAACRHGKTFVQEVTELARRAGVRVEEVLADDPRAGLPGPPISRAVRGAVRLLVEFRWPRAGV